MNDELLATDRIAEKVEEALNIFRLVGIPVRDMTKRRKERAAKALLAVAGIEPDMTWTDATSHFDGTAKPLTTREIIKVWNEHYGESIADSSYDDVRRKDLNLLVEAGLVARSAADPAADVNDGTRGYSIPLEALELLHSYDTPNWEDCLLSFRSSVGALKDRLSKAREFKEVPVTLPDGSRYRLSPGPHNEIQKAVIEEFLPRFSKGTEVLYVGDAAKKILHMDRDRMREVGIHDLGREMLPDIVAYEEDRNWLFLIEAVHSSNPDQRNAPPRATTIDEGRYRGLRFCQRFCRYCWFFSILKGDRLGNRSLDRKRPRAHDSLQQWAVPCSLWRYYTGMISPPD